MLEDTEKKHTDVIDFLTDAAQKVAPVVSEDGKTELKLVYDPKQVYWETRDVDSNQFGASVLELEELLRKGDEAKYNMCEERAVVIQALIGRIYESYKYSVDGKASESRRDKHNSKANLIDKLGRNKTERIYSMRDEAKKSLLQSWLGKDVEEDARRD